MSTTRPKPERSRRDRVVVGALAVVVVLVIGVWALRDTPPMQRAQAQAIARFLGTIADGVAGTVSEIETNGGSAWRGVRAYDPAGGAWVPIDQQDELSARVVVLVHGLDEPGGIWDQLAPALSGDGHTVARFDYANDQAIVRSADAFESALQRLRDAGVQEIDLVCHSMGGLVAREALSRDAFAGLNVSVGTMVTLGTPHKGSPWARLRSIAEAREQVQRWAESDDLDPKRLLGFFNDGDGQAGVDLMPGSTFFRQLEKRSFPSSIRVVCVVGRSDTPNTLFGTLSSASARDLLRETIGPAQAQQILSQIDRAGSEFGDGVVPVSSAVMDGVIDVVIVNANHRGMVRTIELEQRVRAGTNLPEAAEPPAIRVVLDRLRRD
jgi:triacylglycerol esterase/lipase EstA (alpha/beta hydrolase family)